VVVDVVAVVVPVAVELGAGAADAVMVVLAPSALLGDASMAA
jgi:hypothetical protein